MASVKGQHGPDRKARFDAVLRVLSGNPAPLSAPELAVVLREAGYEIDAETPKKWPVRGIPERWARRIARLPRALGAQLSSDWMVEGKGEGPREGANLPVGRPVAARQAREGHNASDADPMTLQKPSAQFVPLAMDGAQATLKRAQNGQSLQPAELGAVLRRAQLVGQAVQQAIVRNEWYGTPNGRAVLIKWLAYLIDEYGAQGADMQDLIMVKRELEEDQL